MNIDFCRIGELCKRQLHLRMKAAKSTKEFKTFGILVNGKQNEFLLITGNWSVMSYLFIRLYNELYFAWIELKWRIYINSTWIGDNSYFCNQSTIHGSIFGNHNQFQSNIYLNAAICYLCFWLYLFLYLEPDYWKFTEWWRYEFTLYLWTVLSSNQANNFFQKKKKTKNINNDT